MIFQKAKQDNCANWAKKFRPRLETLLDIETGKLVYPMKNHPIIKASAKYQIADKCKYDVHKGILKADSSEGGDEYNIGKIANAPELRIHAELANSVEDVVLDFSLDAQLKKSHFVQAAPNFPLPPKVVPWKG